MKKFITRMTRRSWVAIVIAGVVIFVGVAVDPGSTSDFRAEAQLIVPSSSSGDESIIGRPSEANRLALTYSLLIPDDDATLDAVGEAVDRDRADVADRLDVDYQPESSLLTLSYEGSDADEALAGINAAAEAVTGSTPESPAITPRSIELYSIDEEAEGVDETATLRIAITVLLGLALGVIVAIAWERSDPRVDDTADIAHLGIRTSALRTNSSSFAALASRWLEEERRDGERPRIVVTPTLSRDFGTALTLAENAQHYLDRHLRAEGAVAQRIELVAADAPRTDVGLAEALSASATVLVAPMRSSVRAVEDAVARLTQIGRAPIWLVLMPREWAPPVSDSTLAPPPGRHDRDAHLEQAAGRARRPTAGRWGQREGVEEGPIIDVDEDDDGLFYDDAFVADVTEPSQARD